MAVWYVDPEGGNDSNNGSSFALRVKSVSSLTSYAAGDSVRTIASVPAWSLGNGTWTDNSGSVTLAAAATLTVDNAETAWVAGTNITTAASASFHKQGANACAITIGASFTGGLVAYKALGSTTDFSAYSCISMWMTFGGNNFAASTSLQVCLCSDAAGATPVATLAMPGNIAIPNTTFPLPALFENGGSALPSGINSIAIYATGKPFAGTFYIDNIIATTAANVSGHLSHGCVVGKNSGPEPEWYAIQYIDGTTVALGAMNDYSSGAGSRKYRGTTATVTTYALLGLRPRYTNAKAQLANIAGTQFSPITWTGGWDRTAMSTQSGQTWVNGECAMSYGWNNANGANAHQLPDSSMGFLNCVTHAVNANFQAWLVANVLGVTNCGDAIYTAGVLGALSIAMDNAVQCNNGFSSFSGVAASKVKIYVRRIAASTNNGVTFQDLWDDGMADVQIGQIDNGNFGISSATQSRTRVRGTLFQNNQNGSFTVSGGGSGTILLLDNPTLSDSSIGNMSGPSTVRCTGVGGNRWDNRVYGQYHTQLTDQSTVHGTTAQSLKITVNDYTRLYPVPVYTRLASVACISGKTITFTAWMQRSNSANINAGLAVRSGQLAGVSTTTYNAAAAASTWEQGTLTFTPTADGVVDVWGFVGANNSSANTASAWFGDTAVTST